METNSKNVFMIQGFFFYQDRSGQVCRCHYAGMIYQDREPFLEGLLSDDYGESTLFDIEIDEERVSFTKIYHGRKDEIHYQFVRKEPGSPIWIGNYFGTATGSRHANCIITKVPIDFLTPTFCDTNKLSSIPDPTGISN